jgi:hypothetical protein
MTLSADLPQKHSFEHRFFGWRPTTTLSWMVAAFIIAAALATAVLMVFGVGERGTAIALRATARWSFLLFWPAYTGSALARLFGDRFARIARRARDFGLAFAAAQLVHVGLVVWIVYQAPASNGMAFFWVGIVCTYLLALLSLQQLQATLGPRLWRTLRTAAMEYIALVFAADFILLPLQANGHGKSVLSYLPFALLLIGGTALRVAVNVPRQFTR